jgi:hypothetical protein
VLADHRVEVIAFVIKFVMTTASTLIVNMKYVAVCRPPFVMHLNPSAVCRHVLIITCHSDSNPSAYSDVKHVVV